jgi:hypothetical protein
MWGIISEVEDFYIFIQQDGKKILLTPFIQGTGRGLFSISMKISAVCTKSIYIIKVMLWFYILIYYHHVFENLVPGEDEN